MRFFKSILKLFIPPLVLVAFSLLSARPSPAQAQPSPLAPILKTKIFVQKDKDSQENITFNVPESGKAILRIVNGAKIGDSVERFARGEVVLNLNGKEIIAPDTLNEGKNIFETNVSLRKGDNYLKINLPAKKSDKPTKRFSLRIDAPADKIVLTPIQNSLVVGRDPLKAEAKVIGLGMPVPDAEVTFAVYKLGKDIEKKASTGNSGIASTLIAGLSPGNGILQGAVAGTDLSANVGFSVVKEPVITFEPKTTHLTLQIGAMASFRLLLNVAINDKDKRLHLVNISQSISPSPSGINIKESLPGSRFVFPKPSQSIPMVETIEAVKPGRYTLAITATLADTGETARTVVDIYVKEPLVLSPPQTVPAGFPPSAESTEVTFRTLITGMATPPEVLFLDEVTDKGEVIAANIAKLKDNGEGQDSLAGDGFYAATIKIDSPKIDNPTDNDGDTQGKPVEGEKYYRLRAELQKKTVLSGITTLMISNLLKARPSYPVYRTKDPKTKAWLIANEVILRALPDVPAKRIEKIVNETNKSLNEKISIAGFLPSLNLYLIEIDGNESITRLQQIIDLFLAYEEVENASPNVIGEPAGCITDPADPNYDPTDPRFPPCESPNDVASECQYYMQAIRADEAWKWLQSLNPPKPLGSHAVKVAVIDFGIKADHTDLNDQITAVADTDTTATGHGTAVAGIIAAKHCNGQGIAGVAPGTWIEPYKASETSSTWDRDVVDGTWSILKNLDGTVREELKIINISYQWVDPQDNVKAAIENAINHGRLVVVAAGNLLGCPGTENLWKNDWHYQRYPAKYDDPNHPLECSDDPLECCLAALLTVGALDIDRDNDGTPETDGRPDDPNLIATRMQVPDSSPADPEHADPADEVYNGDYNGCSYVQPWIDLYAPGDDIVSTSCERKDAPADTNQCKANGSKTRCEPFDGTSFAAPQVSGAAAVLWAAYPAWTNQDVARCLIDRGRPFNSTTHQLHPLLDGHPNAVTGDPDPSSSEVVGTRPRVLDIYAAVNHSPTDIQLTKYDNTNSEDDENIPGKITISKNTEGCVVGTLTATNPCDFHNSSILYTVSNDDSGCFEVVDDNHLKHKEDCALDYESGSSVQLTITAEDAENLQISKEFTIEVGPSGEDSEPFDIVFVLDRSGSMSLHVDLSDPTSAIRWESLHKAVVDSATLAGFVSEVETEGSENNSRFGMSLFATKVLSPGEPEPYHLYNSDFANLIDIDTNLAPKVNEELNYQKPYGSTAMGLGLQNGVEMLADYCSRPRIIVLFSDGEQNQSPMVKADGTGYEFPESGINTLCPGDDQKVEIVSVGIMGSASGQYYTTLQNLAHENGNNKILITSTGTSFDVSGGSTGIDLDTAFTSAVVEALSGNSPQFITSYRGNLHASVSLPGFMVNRDVKQLILKLTYDHKLKRSELMSLYDKIKVSKLLRRNIVGVPDTAIDVTSYFEPVVVGDETDTIWLRTTFKRTLNNPKRLKLFEPEGEYFLKMSKPVGLQKDLKFRIVCLADDNRLDMGWSVVPSNPQAGAPFSPTVQLNWSGEPLTNATVKARILKPGDDIGDLLAKSPDTVEPVKGKLPDAGSLGDQKLKYLLEKNPEFRKKLLPSEKLLTLSHQGNGMYRANYDPGDVSGVYQIFYYVTADNPDFGKIQRTAVQSAYVRCGTVDMAASNVTVKREGRDIIVNFRPKTVNGRFIGPAQGSAFSVDGTDIKISKITDHQDGSYTLVLTGNPDTKISLKLLGEEIYRGPASKIERRKGFLEQLTNDWFGWSRWIFGGDSRQ